MISVHVYPWMWLQVYSHAERVQNAMALSKALVTLDQFILKGVEGLSDRREKGRGCYGAVYEVRLNGVPCIAKQLHDILVGRGQEKAVSEEDRRAAISRFRE